MSHYRRENVWTSKNDFFWVDEWMPKGFMAGILSRDFTRQ